MSAKEMFNKINYVLYKNDEKCLHYRFIDSDEFYIYFDKEDKTIIYNDNYDSVIDMPALQAINKQVEKLGWK